MPNVPISSQAMADLLDPMFKAIANGQYDKGKSRIGDFFDVLDSTLPTEKYSEITPLPEAVEFDGQLEYTGVDQGYDVTATHVERALGIQVTRTMYDDDQHDIIPGLFSSLGDSFFKKQENDAAGVFNNAFAAASDFFDHSASLALCSSSHDSPNADVSTTSGFSNYGTSALSSTSLAAARLTFRQFKDDAGDKIGMMPNLLIIPEDLEDTAKEILQTPSGYDTAASTKNVLSDAFQLSVWNRLTSSKCWFLANSEEMKKNLKWFWRVRFETARMEKFDTFTALARGYMRYSYLWRNWRFVFGSYVT